MKRWWRDTLFKRLFLLMWFGLVVSHLAAFHIVTAGDRPPGPPGGHGPTLPVLPSLPPSGLGTDTGPPHRLPDPGSSSDIGPALPAGSTATGPNARRPLFPPPPEPLGSPAGRSSTGLVFNALWLDYGIRILVIGVVAWFGARWLSTPMRRLAAAAEGLAVDNAPALLDATHGTLEVRRTAQVFNAMASRLHAQFGAQAMLMAAISHDLRTPLARLRLRLDAMSPGDQTEKGIADVREMDALIGGVLDMLREQRVPTDPVRVDVALLVQALVDDLADQGRPAKMEASPPQPSPLVLAASSVLKRMVGNLIGNALRHGGSARVRVVCEGVWVQVLVDDDGPGIPASQIGAVFEPFRQGDSADPRAAQALEGYGLGLYIARDLAERLGGGIMLVNRPEGGVRATLRLPAASLEPESRQIVAAHG